MVTRADIPVMTITPASQTVSPGDKVKISCSVTQRSSLRWYLNAVVRALTYELKLFINKCDVE